MRLSTIKQTIVETEARARALEPSGASPRAAMLPIYGMTLDKLRLLLSENTQARAWERVALRLADTRVRLLIDALDLSPIEQARRRLTCIQEMPEVTGFTSMQDIYDLISATITLGAPRYNGGDISGCVALYWTTCDLIFETPAARGFAGYARAVAQARPLVERAAPVAPLSPPEVDALAWELRHTLDAIAGVAR